uniref:Vps53_N domain-containing protein n=1 Tax=Caenorhabditis tropicalis TaxID=1561998 RepID=A0A1I7UHN3_9PELO
MEEPSTSELKLSDDVMAEIKDMCITEYCKSKIGLIAQINKLFPTEQSLTQLDSVIVAVEGEISELDNELAYLVETNENVNELEEETLKHAQEAVVELEKSIESIKERTKSSNEIVREMTRDIKQLDIARRNLTASITTLHHLHILLTGVESLGAWVDKKDYSDIARQLPAIRNVLQFFDAYKESEQIANISKQLDKLKASLTIQLARDLKNAFQTGHQLSNRKETSRRTSSNGSSNND